MITPFIAVFAPLLGALLIGLFGRQLGDKLSQIITCALMLCTAGASLILFRDVALLGQSQTILIAPWIDSAGFVANWSLRLDTLSVVMISIVTIVSTCVHVYAVGYMADDRDIPRFMAYLSLFTFFMLMLVTANDLLQMFFGWEGVGLASYLLINFWYEKDTANKAAMKAFIVNRVGDFGFVLGIFACFVLFGSISFDVIFERAPELAGTAFNFMGFNVDALTCAALLLFIGAMGKSAQLGLHTWLPDAMEGPTPVSALIHAATMVTAGVFMVARMSPMFEYAPDALAIIAVLGAITAIAAASIGLTQFDIKRVIAYSTMSQLGYMFFALGVSAYSAAIFHLMTHAFFKALLFLGAGAVIHALHHEQDMRKMGGIWKKIPLTYAFMWIGSLALAGIGIYDVFGFAGYYSKDLILESAWAAHSSIGAFAYWMGIIAALFTAFYSWRLIIMTFHGKPRMDHHTYDEIHGDTPFIMRLPLYVLAFGAIFAGYMGYELFVGETRNVFWAGSLFVLPQHDTVSAAHHVPLWVKILPVGIALLGILLAYVFYLWLPGLPAKVSAGLGFIYRAVYNKYYFDELYEKLFVKPASKIGLILFETGDKKIIDGVGPDGFAHLAQRGASSFSLLQTGFLFHYAFVMVLGLVALLGWLVWRG